MGKGSGGGGSSQPQQVSSTTNTSNLPEYAAPYFTSLMDRAQTASNDPYQAYNGQRIQSFTPNQQAGINSVQNNYGSYQPAFDSAWSGLSNVQDNVSGANFNPGQVTNSYSANSYNPENWTDPGVSQSYMSPYQKNVTDIQTREANRQFGIQNTQLNAGAQKAGAFGGYRHGIVDAEAQRNQNMQLNDIQSQGLNSAYNAGMGQFNQDRGAGFAAAQYGNQNQQTQAQYGMAAQQANNQYGLGYNSLGAQIAGAQADFGKAYQQAGLADSQSLLNVGAQEQAIGQQGLDVAYQDFINQRDYNRQNLGWVGGILRGVPTSANTNVTGYQAPPSTVSQLAGLGLSGVGLSKLLA